MTTTAASTTQPKRVGRKRQVIATLTALGIVGAGVAYAFLSGAGYQGSAPSARFAAEWSGTSSLITANGSSTATAAQCPTVSLVGGKINLSGGTGIFPGDRCAYGANLVTPGATGKLVSLTHADLATMAPGWQVDLRLASANTVPGSACKATGGVGNIDGTGQYVYTVITRLPDAPADGSTLSVAPLLANVDSDTTAPRTEASCIVTKPAA